MEDKIFRIELDALFAAKNIDEAFRNLAYHFQDLAAGGNADAIFLSESYCKIHAEYDTIEEYQEHKEVIKP